MGEKVFVSALWTFPGAGAWIGIAFMKHLHYNVTMKAHCRLAVDEVGAYRLFRSIHVHLPMRDLLKIWTIQMQMKGANVGFSLTRLLGRTSLVEACKRNTDWRFSISSVQTAETLNQY